MSYITKILFRDGAGYPGTVLDQSEPAFDTTNNDLYIGTGVGDDPIKFLPDYKVVTDSSLGPDFYWSAGLLEVSIGSIGDDFALKVNVDASFGDVYTALDTKQDASVSIYPYSILFTDTDGGITSDTLHYQDNRIKQVAYDPGIYLGINAGDTDSANAGGQLDIRGGDSSTGTGGTMSISGGDSGTGQGGDVWINGGNGATQGTISIGYFGSHIEMHQDTVFDLDVSIVGDLYVGGELITAPDVTKEYVDGSLATRDTNITTNADAITVIEGEQTIQDTSIANLKERLDVTDASLALQVETYYFVTDDYELPVPTGSQNVIGVKNISATDISIYTADGTYAFDNENADRLYSMNTIDLYDYDASNWYII